MLVPLSMSVYNNQYKIYSNALRCMLRKSSSVVCDLTLNSVEM